MPGGTKAEAWPTSLASSANGIVVVMQDDSPDRRRLT